MGGNSSKKRKTETSSSIGKEFSCPLCNQLFDANTTFNNLNTHIIACAQNNNRNIISDSNLNSYQSVNSINSIHQSITNRQMNSSVPLSNIIQINSPKSSRIERGISLESIEIKKDILTEEYNFEKKLQELKSKILAMKVDWRIAHCNMEIDREYILKDSMKKYESIDPLKELKINFKGEVSYDAGGIIREWFTVIIKELQSHTLNLFERGDGNEFSYIIKKNLNPSSKNLEYFNFLGKIMAKALLENITVNYCLNKLIYKIILNETIKFEDLIFIDRPLYNSLCEMKKMDNIESLELYYIYEYRDEKGNLITDELKKNGSNEKVKDINDYIYQRIKYMINKNSIFVSQIKAGLFNVLPEKLINIFNSDEFELILNGQPFIDVEEWKANTIYQGKYNAKHKVIKWFWDIMFTFSQEELSKFLQFCTGTTRVPLGGFSVLESNRGEIAKFCIVQVNYNSKSHNFIKAHTCFNRVDLPNFNSEKQVKEAINYIINNEILGFGID